MKIRKLKLENFRQFFGAHILEFSTDEAQTITVIHGENGAGKTSILNAFKWCFYGHTDFDTGEENILNEHAISKAAADEKIPMTAQIEFEHDGWNYIAKRTLEFVKSSGFAAEPIGGSVFELSWTDQDGRYQKSHNPSTQINQILPEKMHSYFFFNGERIEKLAYASASHEIRQAIRTLMGLEIVERARDHLSNQVKRHFSKQKQRSASKELSEVIGRQDELENEISSKKKEIYTETDNIEEFDQEIALVTNRLKSIEQISHLQKERDRIDARLSEIRSEKEEIRFHINQRISETGFLAFIDTVHKKVDSLLEDRRQKGELPYQVKRQFIDDLLENQKCICGTPLTPGTDSFGAVEQFKKAAEHKGIEDAFIDTSGTLKQVAPSRAEFFERVRELLKRRQELDREKDTLVGRLDEIGKEVTESEIEDAVELEQRRSDLRIRRDESVAQKGRLQGEVEEREKNLKQVIDQRKELEKKSDKADIAQKRYDLSEECARVLTDLHEALSHRTKEHLSERVNKTFQSILQKDYWADIDDDYRLQIYKDIPGHGAQVVYEKSTGESQVTSLSFIGSIVSLAKEQHRNERQFFRGGIYPIIMDSPFGALDPTYREMIARYIPDLADQIILMVSGTQWKGEVESECKARVGKHISLIYHSPKVGEGKESYYVRPGADFEHTELEEGYYG